VFPDPGARRLAEEIVRIGRLLGARGLFVADDGNLSARCPDGTIWITPRGVRKDALSASDLVRVDGGGRIVEGEASASSELRLHLAIYGRRADVGAIIHAHPPVATGFAAAGQGIPDDVLAEVAVALGPVPVVPYAMPGTREMEEVLAPFLSSHQAFLLSNHGAVALGGDVEEAGRRMERLEHVARVLLAARLLGGAKPLTREERKALEDRFQEEPWHRRS